MIRWAAINKIFSPKDQSNIARDTATLTRNASDNSVVLQFSVVHILLDNTLQRIYGFQSNSLLMSRFKQSVFTRFQCIADNDIKNSQVYDWC
jgi:hypothetical protein